MKFGDLEMSVLLAVLDLGVDAACGIEIHDRLKGDLDRELERSEVYATLRRLEEKGLVARHDIPARKIRGGRKRVGYGLTAGGQLACSGWKKGSRARADRRGPSVEGDE